ncbi:MAG: hypothetical protein DLM65_04400 [Candidatus Aeolococcus gillhamiae]|uniref:Uncharacterized protein n=1 Tax=Candidatus Aeolococcus gillhamiae TaxID=3127015 RepID=A0A2W5ZE16_9BACT|nr:MAG: hypothetical protein DLM65_04400 [Candidatus Dormibacter sp. RRmetagenome_bin12]
MSSLTVALPRALRRGDRSRVAARRVPRRWPIESTFLFLVSFIVYMAVADYLVIHLHYTNADAYTRVADATYVLYSRDPHLGAIGFIWPPLPGLLNIPILALQHWFPFLINHAFAGSVQAALFGAGSVVLINLGLRRAGVILPVRWLVLAVWIANPMTALYSAQGMSEAPFVFFVIASLLSFIRWTDSRKPGELAALGVLVGLGTLVRVEMIPMAIAVGAGVFVCSLAKKTSWRQLETQMLLYALPAVFLFALWIGSTWVIERDPLYIFHSSYSQQAAATGGFGASAVGNFTQWHNVVSYIGLQYLQLFPAVVVLVAAVAVRTLVARDRRPGLVLLGLALPVPLVDMYLLHSGNLPLILRYQIYVIPYTMVLGIFLLKEFGRVSPRVVSVAALLLVAVVGISNMSSFQLMSDVQRAPEESVAILAAENNVSAGAVNNQMDPYDSAIAVAQSVALADKDHGLIAMDTFRGSAVYMTAPDRSTYVVTSDEDFEAVVNQPQVYHVEYFLVPKPEGESTLDHINQLYPTLWANGDNFATKVAEIGGQLHWRLYRITGVTGRA